VSLLQRWIDVEEVEARTPPDRDRVADLLRLSAILAVVFGHWLVAAVLHRDGELVAGQVLQWVPETRLLTWVFQVMPLFFFVGGHLNAGSWRRARDDGQAWPRWLRRRARRLLTPLVPLLGLWVAIVLAADLLPFSGTLIAAATEAALLPLWFLVVYVLVIALVPLTHRLHERFGLWVPAGAMVLTGVVDALDRADVPLVGYLSYLLLWGGIHQLGYLWEDRRLPRPPAAATIAVGATGVAMLLIARFGYPVSMVAVFGAERANTDPPSLALWAYAIAQLAIVTALRPTLARWLRRPEVWAPVIMSGSAALTLFLWHMTAMVVVAAAVHPTGLWPRLSSIDGTWWALRPLWLLLCTVVLAVLVAVFRRFEDQPDPVPRSGYLRAGVGTVAFAFGMAWLMTQGLHDPTNAAGLRLVPLGLVVLGLASLGALRPRRWLPASDGTTDAE
jgi:fucose 4-O-acetylase-like acetyltransferase